eukprot:sb/3477145/
MSLFPGSYQLTSKAISDKVSAVRTAYFADMRVRKARSGVPGPPEPPHYETLHAALGSGGGASVDPDGRYSTSAGSGGPEAETISTLRIGVETKPRGLNQRPRISGGRCWN